MCPAYVKDSHLPEPTYGALDRTAQLLAKLLSGSEDPDLTALSEAVKATSYRPYSAQSQLARARAVGLVTGPHARILRTHSQWVVGPGRTPQRTSGRGWESARPQTPHIQARGAPPGRPRAAPTARKASSQERVRWGW